MSLDKRQRFKNRMNIKDIGTEWREVKFDFRPETFKDGRMSSGACYLYFYFQQEDAPNTIWFDDLEYSIKRADDKSARITKPLAVNPSFEIGLDGWEIQVDEAAAGYKNTRGRMSIDTDAAVGKYSLKVMKPRNPPDLKANCRTLIRPLPFHQQLNRDFTISFWAKSDKPTKLVLCLTYTGIGSFSLTPEWKRFTASYKARRALHPGETADELRIFSPNDGATVWLDGFQIEPGKTATEFKPDADYEAGTVIPDRVYKLVRNGESFPLRIYAVSYINDPKAKKIRLTVSDFFGKQVHQEVHPLSFKGRDTRTLDLILKTGKPGQFKARAEILDAEGKTLVSGDSVFAVLNPPMEIPTEKSSIGINENIVNSRSGAPAYLWQCNNNLDDYLAALRLAGIRHMRIWDVGDWRSQEPRPGDFNFVWDDFLKRVKAQKIGTHVCFMPSSRRLPDWSQSTTGYLHPERHRGKFIPKLEDAIRFTEAYSKHYKGLIDSIGWMNETGDLAPKDYVDFAKALRPVFKKTCREQNFPERAIRTTVCRIPPEKMIPGSAKLSGSVLQNIPMSCLFTAMTADRLTPSRIFMKLRLKISRSANGAPSLICSNSRSGNITRNRVNMKSGTMKADLCSVPPLPGDSAMLMNGMPMHGTPTVWRLPA